MRCDHPIFFSLHSSSETSAGSGRLMGGTGITVLHDLVGRIEKDGNGGDPLGRWSFVHLRRPHQPPVTVISIYQVCQAPTNSIGSTSWHQQRRALDLQDCHQVHPRTAFIHDLTEFLQPLQQKRHSIIIGGDWNDHGRSNNSTIQRLCTRFSLTDPWIHHHPTLTAVATHERGQHRIDVMLVSHDILLCIMSIGYSPVGTILSSDHRTLSARISLTRLFNTHKQDPLRPIQLRKVRSNDRRSVTTFIEAMHRHLLQNHTFTLGTQLLTGDPMDPAKLKLVETIDTLIGQAGDHGEKKCKSRRKEWYSIPLVQQRLTVSYIKHYLNGLLNQKDRYVVICKKLSLIESDIILPPDIQSTRELLRKVITKLAELKQTSKSERSKFLIVQNQKHTRRLNKHETAITTWKTIAFLKSSSRGATLDKLEIPASWPPPFTDVAPTMPLEHPKSASEWSTVTKNPAHIEYYLLLRNRIHFGQAHGTPFTIQPLSDAIPWGAQSSMIYYQVCTFHSPLFLNYVSPSWSIVK